MKENVIKVKSFQFAVKAVYMFKQLQDNQREFILSKQFIKSGTSIGANIREGINAESKPDFIHKLHIAQKECDESIYWLELLHATKYISEEDLNVLKSDAIEIMRIIRSIIITSKRNLKNA
jgi:four helix bundle protein